MATTIQIKRGTGSAVPSGLEDGELAINLDNGKLFFGSGSTSINSFRFENLTAENYIVSSSVTNITTQELSGSTNFGDSSDDSHTFTGAITASKISIGSNITHTGDPDTSISFGVNSIRLKAGGIEIFDAKSTGFTTNKSISSSADISASGNISATDYFDNGTNISSIYQAALTFGIANTNVLRANSNIVDNDFLRVDGTSIEGRSAAQVLSDIGAQSGIGDGDLTIAMTDELQDTLNLKATIASPTFTGTVVLPNVPAIVTTQLNLKSPIASPSFTGQVTASGNISSSGTIIAAAAVLTTADINGGTIDGITSLTAGGNLDIGTHELRAATFESDVSTGTAPFTVASTTEVANLKSATSTLAATATNVTVSDNESTNESNVITFVAGAAGSGNVGLEADGNLTYNPSTGKVTATGFIGALTGDVTGDVTGNADTATLAADATTLATPRAINGVDFDGSAAITVTAAGSTLSDTVTVAKGGTGATSFADKSVIITQDSGTDTLAAVAMSTNGQILIGGSSGPAVAVPTGGDGLTVTVGDGTLEYDLDAALTTVTSILAADVKIGEDDQTKIDFETANEIHFYANNVEQVYVADNIFGPQSDSDVDLGTTGVRWKDAFIDTITTTGDVDVLGNIELGHASDTTIARASAGQITVEGTAVLLAGSSINTDGEDIDMGSGTLSAQGAVVSTIELGHASDTTIARASSGQITVEGTAVLLAGAQTGITSLLAADIKIGEDDQTKIDFETANEIHFYANNTEQVYLADNIFGPQSDSDVDLGTTGVRWKDAFIDTITTTGTITAGGIVTGTGFTAGNAVLAEAELELLDGLTAGTAIASKVVTTDGSKDTTGQRNLTISGELDAATGDFSGIIDVAGVATLASAVVTAGATFGGGTGATGVTISTGGAITADAVIKTESTTNATSTTDGSIQTDGGLSVALDVIIGDDLSLLSDDAVFNMGEGSDVTITHDGTTGAVIAATPISINSTGDLTLDSTTDIVIDAAGGNVEFKDAGTLQLTLDMDGTAGEQIIQLGVDSDDLVFKQYDGTEVLRIGDDTTISANRRKFTATADTAGLHDGDVVYFGGTTSMTTGAIYHYKSDGTWELADADAVATSDGLLGVALGAASNTNGVLLRGIVTLDHDAGAIGDVLYLSTTAGDCGAAAPSGTNDVVRIVGYKIIHATQKQVWFNPSNDFIIHA